MEKGRLILHNPAWFVAALVFVATSVPPRAQVWQDIERINFRTPQRSYHIRFVGRWEFWVEQPLARKNRELADMAVKRTEKSLNQILAFLPSHALPVLSKLRIVILEGPTSPGSGWDNGMRYISQSGAGDERVTDVDARWGHTIVIHCATSHANQSEFWVIKPLLHELAHAYHLSRWGDRGEAPAALEQAWRNAKATGLYRNLRDTENPSVTYSEGYALANLREYFAELTVMYFSRCNYGPQSREELKRYDPAGYAVVEKMWTQQGL